MSFFRKMLVVGVVMLQAIGSTSCAKIDSFEKPHMLEGFTGVVKVSPGIEGITAKTYAPGLVFFNGNKSGTEVMLYAMPDNFSLYSILPDGDDSKELFRAQMEKHGISALDKLDFSGFRGRVDPKDGKRVEFYDFGSQSEGMKKFKWTVKGKALIDGPDSHIKITISTTVGVLQELLPDQILSKLGGPGSSDVSLAEFEDKDAVVYLAQIEVLGESLTFGY